MRIAAPILAGFALCACVWVYIIGVSKPPVRYEITAPNSTTTTMTSNGKTTVTTRTTKRITIRLKGTDKEVYLTLKE